MTSKSLYSFTHHDISEFRTCYYQPTFALMQFTDQLGRTIELKEPPKRIISVVPSQTELLYDLGMDEVIGITKFCVHPESWFRTKTRIGGTKTLNIAKIKELHPDLIIANKEENVKEQIEELEKDFPVFVTDVNILDDAYQMIYQVGKLVGKERRATEMIQQINAGFAQLQKQNSKLQTAYLIWKDPYMTVGGDTFIDDMLYYAGFTNIFSDKSRYPEITITDLHDRSCELLLLSSEPYPFKQKHIDEIQEQLPNTKIILVDGEMFSWYGSRLLQAPEYFKELQPKLL
jgi:ABC-type Fe3+-hydroxamate transport system substrate-binding protein